MAEPTWQFSEDFQIQAVAHIWRSPGALMQHAPHLKPQYITVDTASILYGMMLDHYTSHKVVPTEASLTERIRGMYPNASDVNEQRKRDALESRLAQLKDASLLDADFTDHKIREFSMYISIRTFLIDTKDDLIAMKFDPELPVKLRKAMSVGDAHFDIGHDWGERIDERIHNIVNPEFCPRIPTGLPHLDALISGGLQAGELGVLLALPKHFKCHDGDDKVLMFNGSSKMARYVVVGDLLMGDDSKPRRVWEVKTGRSQMYNITQSNGDSYKVTDEHVLCLKRPDGSVPNSVYGRSRYHSEQILEMTAEEYSKQKAGFKRNWKGYKVGVEFPARPTPVDPYYIGLWIGDGLNRGTGICVADGDVETEAYLREMAGQWGLRVHEEFKWLPSDREVLALYRILHLNRVEDGGNNRLIDAIRSVGLGRGTIKHVPDLYKMNDRSVRLKVLAGMIDSDGHFKKNHGFIFNNANRQLCDDACWLARSVGLKAHVQTIKSFYRKKDGTKVFRTSFRTMIQGKVTEIPTLLPRKAGKDSVRVTERTTINVEPVGEGDWFGFRVDGNHRYLLSDFTVTHNSGTMLNFGFSALRQQQQTNVLYITLELSEELVGMRFDMRTALMTKDDMMRDPDRFMQRVHDRKEIIIGNNRLFIKGFKTKSCTCDTIRTYLDHMWAKEGIKFGTIIVDYLDLLKASKAREKAYLDAVDICEDLRSLASKQEYSVPIWTAARATREAVGKRKINMAQMSTAFERVAVSDLTLALCVARNQGIKTDHGIVKSIDVRKRLKDGAKINVLSHNFTTGTDEWKPIINWFHNGHSTDPFVQLKFNTAWNQSKTSTTTKEHHFFRVDGTKVEAGELLIGDEVAGNEYVMSAAQREIMMATMLGDAHIRKDGGMMVIGHHEHQHYYLDWLSSVFHGSGLTGSIVDDTVGRANISGRYVNATPYKQVLVCKSIDVKLAREMFYPNGVKVVPQHALDCINELGLAVLLMDDGSIRRNGDRITLHMQGFSDADRAMLRNWFSTKWGVHCVTNVTDKLEFTAESSRKLLILVEPFLVKQYDSVTGETKKFLCPCVTHGEVAQHPIKVVSTNRKKLRNAEKIDIEVADNHNYYLSSGVLVSNCMTEQEKVAGEMRIVNVASRNDSINKVVNCKVDFPRMLLTSVGTSELDEEDSEEETDRKEWKRKKKSSEDDGDDRRGGAKVIRKGGDSF